MNQWCTRKYFIIKYNNNSESNSTLGKSNVELVHYSIQIHAVHSLDHNKFLTSLAVQMLDGDLSRAVAVIRVKLSKSYAHC